MSTKLQSAVREVLETIPLVMRTLYAEFRHTEYALPPVHFRLLHILAGHPRNLSELAGKQRVSPPTMSNSITTLVERGWVKRVRDPHDRRMVLIELTPAGRAVLSGIRREAEARVAELLAPLSPAECDQLLAGLAILREVLTRAVGDAECLGES
jgi:DNA-binding MarR family transcriptional regulator